MHYFSDWLWLEVLYFNNQILVYHILFTDGTTGCAAADDFVAYTLFYCKACSDLEHSSY